MDHVKDTWAAAEAAGLRNGDALTRSQFHERYLLLDDIGGVELVEGVVYLPYYVQHRVGQARGRFTAWLGTYAAAHGFGATAGGTVLLDEANEVEPSALLFESERRQLTEDDFLAGPPLLVVEVAHNERSLAMQGKSRAYAKAGVPEYVVHLVETGETLWFHNDGGHWRQLAADPDGVIRSEAFPGLELGPDGATTQHFKRYAAAPAR